MKRLNKLGYTKVEIMGVIAILGLVAFIAINKISYAFATNDNNAAKEIISLIEKQAQKYALNNKEIFSDNNITYISVNDLISNEYLIPNEKGLITSPNNSNKSYNDNKIKLEFKDNEVIATFVE